MGRGDSGHKVLKVNVLFIKLFYKAQNFILNIFRDLNSSALRQAYFTFQFSHRDFRGTEIVDIMVVFSRLNCCGMDP